MSHSNILMEDSALQNARYSYVPKLPSNLTQDISKIGVELGPSESFGSQKILQEVFKITSGKPLVTFVPGKNEHLRQKLAVGLLLSGGQAPGGHNVIAGIFDGLKKGNSQSKLYGFLDGPGGLIKNKFVELTAPVIDKYRNTGGFDMIGSGRTKIETPEQFASSLKNAQKLGLDAVVIIGGDDSNTNAALLAEYFEAHAVENKDAKKVQVIGCPKTIDGDLKNEYIEASFGFDTAVKVYSNLVGNIQRDTMSSKKNWHFIKLMGRSASHITLECALQTHACVSLISEEVAAKKLSLGQVVEQISDSVVQRSANGEDFGTVLVPEGLIEFIPEMQVLIAELNDIIALNAAEFAKLVEPQNQRAWLSTKLSSGSATVYKSLPVDIANQLVLERDPHGNVIVSSIETEKLLMNMVAKRLAELKTAGKYVGTFRSMTHFFGFEGRCAAPTNFDANYCYSLGFCTFVLIGSGLTGYMACVRNLAAPVTQWFAGGIPLTMMMDVERRSGAEKPVIRKALVDLAGAPFRALEAGRTTWSVKTSYLYPGSIQYFGPPEVCDQPTVTLKLEHKK